MKKTIAFIAILATALSFASAKKYSFTFGAHGFIGEGWGTSWDDDMNVSSDATAPFGDNMLFGAGAFVNLPITGGLGIQPEVNFMANNAAFYEKANASLFGLVSGTFEGTTKYSYNSIDIPVLFTYKLLKFNVLVGPYISIPVTDITKNVSGTITQTNFLTGESSDPYTPDAVTLTSAGKPVFGMAFGANIAERMGGMYLIFGARYMLDFSPMQYVTTASDGTKTYHNVATRRGLTLDAGIRFAL